MSRLKNLTRWETWLGVALLIFLTVFRWRSISRFRIDSDEPQHLHVVWGWTRGLLPYRDFFDNHTPLFHIFYAPVLSLLGERADILVAMRIAELPLFALTLWCVYALGRRVYDARTGWWAMLLTACEATFFFTSLEFRADVLWALLWMLTLLVLLSADKSGTRVFLAGLLLGATLGTSIKTALLIASFCLASVIWVVLQKLARSPIEWRKILSQFALLVSGSVVIPLALAGYFYLRGGLKEMAYCLFHHNTRSAASVPALDPTMLVFPGLLAAAILVVWFFHRGKNGIAFRSAFLVLGTAIYGGLLVSFWSLLTPLTNQDFLPFTPMLMLVLAPGLLWLTDRCPRWLQPLLWLAVFTGLLVPLLRDPIDNTPNPGRYERFLAIVLKLTEPDDYVMDAKGEAIFRRRPYYYCLETQTRRKLIAGDLPDDIPERLIATRTPVTRTNRLPDRAEAFVEKHYLRIGSGTSVLGQYLTASDSNSAHYSFEVGVPERYVIVGKDGPVTGTLDGQPFTNAMELASGSHQFIRTSPQQPLALFWARAEERGFSAFAARKVENGDP